jgi:hypothetical protein
MAASLVPYCAIPVVAKPAVTSANRNVMKIVFLISLISSPPSDLGPACQTLCQANGRIGERLKMIRTAVLPSNNAQQNRTV